MKVMVGKGEEEGERPAKLNWGEKDEGHPGDRKAVTGAT